MSSKKQKNTSTSIELAKHASYSHRVARYMIGSGLELLKSKAHRLFYSLPLFETQARFGDA